MFINDMPCRLYSYERETEFNGTRMNHNVENAIKVTIDAIKLLIGQDKQK